MKYQEALNYIEEITGLGIVPGLESIKELCRDQVVFSYKPNI